MAYPVQSARAVIHANMANGAEIAEWGFWVGPITIASESDAQTAVNSIAADFGTNGSAIQAILSTDCTYDKVTLYAYPDGGTKAVYVAEADISGGGGNGSATAPLTQSLVVTLRTGFAGRSRRGRVYLPACGIEASSGHIFPTTATNNAINAVAAFFSDVGSDVAPVVVASTVTGQRYPVTAVDGDYKPDVQRRRSNRLAGGTRHSQAVTS